MFQYYQNGQTTLAPPQWKVKGFRQKLSVEKGRWLTSFCLSKDTSYNYCKLFVWSKSDFLIIDWQASFSFRSLKKSKIIISLPTSSVKGGEKTNLPKRTIMVIHGWIHYKHAMKVKNTVRKYVSRCFGLFVCYCCKLTANEIQTSQ